MVNDNIYNGNCKCTIIFTIHFRSKIDLYLQDIVLLPEILNFDKPETSGALIEFFEIRNQLDQVY